MTGTQAHGGMSVNWAGRMARRARELQPSAIREVSRRAQEPGFISFASGSPNPDFFPADAVAAALTAVFADPVRRRMALQYGFTEGLPPLRELVAARVGGTAEGVQITSGSQQALSLVAALLLEPGDAVIVTEPTYLGALQAFSLYQPHYLSVPMHGAALDKAALERAFAEGAKFMYAMPDFGNPTGTSLPDAQRARILELSARYGVPVLEDQAYDQLRLSGEARPTLFSQAPERVIHAGTFSKSLAPGLRVGWLAADPAVTARLTLLKQASDLHVSPLTQLLVLEVLRTEAPGRGAALRDGYRGQRDTMLAALERHMPPRTSWTRPEGGMFIWMTLPDSLAAETLLRVAMDEEKVLFVPGAPFFTDGSGQDTLRLSFSLVPPKQIEAGIERLGRAIRRCLQTNDINHEDRA